MREDNLKKHKDRKHSNSDTSLHHAEVHQPIADIVIDNQHNDEVKAKDSEIEELDHTPLHDGANLKFELQRDDEVYQKNVDIGEQISILLESENIREKSLSKQNKFCLDLFRAQRQTTDVKNAELRLLQDQLLDIIEDNQMDDRKIIWVIGREGNEVKSWFQSYIQSLYGSHRFELTNKTDDHSHIMSLLALETTDTSTNAVCHVKSVIIYNWK